MEPNDRARPAPSRARVLRTETLVADVHGSQARVLVGGCQIVAYHHWMQIDIKGFARAGAQARLAELAAEIQAIRRAFPGLDGASERRSIIAADGDGQRQSRRRMSAAERKAVSTRMKKYWASRRKATGTQALSATAPATTVKTASAPKRVMSAEAKQKISAAQKKRWAAQKGGAKKR